MASFLAHGWVAVQLGRASTAPPRGKRFWALALLCAAAPDVDLLGLVFGVEDESVLFHGGLAHSLAFAAVLALLVTALGFRELKPGSRPFWKMAGFFFAVTFAHDLVDAMVVAGPGVAFFSPLWNRRFSLPFTPLITSPFGALDAWRWAWPGMVVNELLFVCVPVTLLGRWVRERRLSLKTGVFAGAWLAVLGVVAWRMPELVGHRLPRVMVGFADLPEVERPSQIPTEGLPDGGLVLRWGELQADGLFERELAPDAGPWSSSFFPSWCGGIAGRWQDGRPRLVWRTLVGFDAPSEAGARQLLERADAGALDRLSPTEKYDLAVGDLGFHASRLALGDTHNARPRTTFSEGLCNAIAAASYENPEPFRAVEVVGVTGTPIRFHPQDVKALLAGAWNKTARAVPLGARCGEIAFDTDGRCSMNPGAFVLALANRIGLAHRTALVQVHPSLRWQYYAIASARLHVARGPYPVVAPSLPRARSAADLEVTLTVSSTVVPESAADVRDPSGSDGTFYRRVGLRPLRFAWSATVALDEQGDVIGGKWTGPREAGPDQLAFIEGPPKLTPHGFLEDDPYIQFEVVRALAAASVDARPDRPPLDLRELCARVPCSPPSVKPAP